MLQWLKRLFFPPERERFLFPPRKRPLPACRIRPYEDRDFDACFEIYCLNEPGRFPAGYQDHFAQLLRNRGVLCLVCEVAGQVRGFGGLAQERVPEFEFATLCYGMVHPRHQREGYGTVLLLARLATLPAPDQQWIVLIHTYGSSDSFYERFGFTRTGTLVDDRQTEFTTFLARFYLPDWKTCRNLLAASSVWLETIGAIIPASTTQKPPTAEETKK